MTFLPIVERELRVRARRPSTYRVRFGSGLAAILLGGTLLLMNIGMSGPGTAGVGVYRFGAGLVLLFCLAEGLRNTADCLSQEKRDGTLGLLFLTDLKGYDVVFGKLAAHSLNSLYALLAVLPPLAIPLILGGVTLGEFSRLALALVNALFFSLTVGIFISVLSRRETMAWLATLCVLAFFCVALSLIGLIPLKPFTSLPTLSPVSAFLSSFEARYLGQPQSYWLSLGLVQALTWGFLIFASWRLPTAWQEEPIPTLALASPISPVAPRVSTGFVRSSRRQELLESHPIVWALSRDSLQARRIWLVVGTMIILALGALLLGRGATWVVGAIVLASILSHFALAVWIAALASFAFAKTRESGMLELLLISPRSTEEIIVAHVIYLKALFRKPLLLLLGIEVLVILIYAAISAYLGGNSDRVIVGGMAGILTLAASVLDFYGAGYLGLWLGLKHRRPVRALTQTVLCILILPWLAMPCLFFGAPLWPILNLVKNLLFVSYAKGRLHSDFHRIVAGHEEVSTERMTIAHGIPEVASSQTDRSQLPGVTH